MHGLSAVKVTKHLIQQLIAISLIILTKKLVWLAKIAPKIFTELSSVITNETRTYYTSSTRVARFSKVAATTFFTIIDKVYFRYKFLSQKKYVIWMKKESPVTLKAI